MSFVRMVLADIAPEALGPTNYHEHLFQSSPLLPGDELDQELYSGREAALLYAAGMTAMVEATPPWGWASIPGQRHGSLPLPACTSLLRPAPTGKPIIRPGTGCAHCRPAGSPGASPLTSRPAARFPGKPDRRGQVPLRTPALTRLQRLLRRCVPDC